MTQRTAATHEAYSGCAERATATEYFQSVGIGPSVSGGALSRKLIGTFLDRVRVELVQAQTFLPSADGLISGGESLADP